MSDNHMPDAARQSFLYSLPFGAGVMAAVDEIVFHQLLQWHHFFDRATPFIGVLSDGLLHAAELLALVAGSMLLLQLARQGRLMARHCWAGLLLGAGGFQLFDGIVSHKLLRIHQICYDVDLFLYDLTWNGIGLALIVLGYGLWRSGKRLQ